VALGLALLLGVAACGGGDGGGGGYGGEGGAGPTAEDFRAQAEQVCRDRRATIEEEASKLLAGGQLPSPEEFGRLANETIIPEVTAQLEELRNIEPPEDVADDFEAYLSQAEQMVQGLRQDPSPLMDAANFQELNEKADAVGLPDACDIGPS